MARRIIKYGLEQGEERLKATAWRIEKSNEFPEGIKYSFVYLVNNRRVIGYDNERAKGHHRHFIRDEALWEEKTAFTSLRDIFRRFLEDVQRFRRENQGKESIDQDSK